MHLPLCNTCYAAAARNQAQKAPVTALLVLIGIASHHNPFCPVHYTPAARSVSDGRVRGAMTSTTTVSYVVLGIYMLGICAVGILGAVLTLRRGRQSGQHIKVRAPQQHVQQAPAPYQQHQQQLSSCTHPALRHLCISTRLSVLLHDSAALLLSLHAQEHYVAGLGLATITWFFTMSASLFSGYTVSGCATRCVCEWHELGCGALLAHDELWLVPWGCN